MCKASTSDSSRRSHLPCWDGADWASIGHVSQRLSCTLNQLVICILLQGEDAEELQQQLSRATPQDMEFPVHR